MLEEKLRTRTEVENKEKGRNSGLIITARAEKKKRILIARSAS
jgi:hypothetical protein